MIEGEQLSFYQHSRQRYAGVVGLMHDGVDEFMLGDYGRSDEDEGVFKGGEFKIAIKEHNRGRGTALVPQIQCFGDALGSLKHFLANGGDVLMSEDCESTEEFARRLIKLGIFDRSDKLLPTG